MTNTTAAQATETRQVYITLRGVGQVPKVSCELVFGPYGRHLV
jgi:hypothetical protein